MVIVTHTGIVIFITRIIDISQSGIMPYFMRDYILRIKFIPEPQAWVMLIAGVSLLGVGARKRRR